MATFGRTKNMRRMTAAALCSLAGLTLNASADLPPVLDRVPTDVQVVAAVKNIGASYARIKGLGTTLGMPADEMAMMDEIIAMPGLNKDGSMAFAISAIKADKGAEGQNSKPNVVMLAPVSDYKAFVTGLGATGTDGVTKLTLKPEQGGREYYAKDLGGGFAAIAQTSEELASFEGKGGNAEAHSKLVGKLGSAIGGDSDVFIVANVAQMQDLIAESQKKMEEQGSAIAAMAGPQGEQLQAQMKMVSQAMAAFGRDASVGIIGLGIGEKGVSIDMGAQFKEGTPSAAIFQSKGGAAGMLSRVPTTPYYFAFSMDTSAPGIKAFAQDMVRAGGAGQKTPGMTDVVLQQIPKLDGIAMVVGASPGGIMGGILANTVYYAKTSDPQSFVDSYKKIADDVNGKTIDGVTFKTTFAAGSSEIEGVKVDSWSMQMQPDPNNPAAMGIQQAQQMMYGMGGQPAGFLAKLDGGVVMTMSPSTPLMASAIKASKDGNGLAADPLIKESIANLPEGRTMEGYIGVKSILDAVTGLMAMMGAGGGYQTPASLAPIVMGGTTTDGAMRLKTFVPATVMTAIGDFAKSMKPAEGEDEEEAPAPEDKSGKPPRF